MTGRTVRADENVRRGRTDKAEQLSEAAEAVRALADEADNVADACVTPCVHAGIAAADAISAARPGRRSRGQDHGQAVALLATVDRGAASRRRSLPDAVTMAGYGHEAVSRDRAVRAGRDVDALLELAGSAVS